MTFCVDGSFTFITFKDTVANLDMFLAVLTYLFFKLCIHTIVDQLRRLSCQSISVCHATAHMAATFCLLSDKNTLLNNLYIQR